MKLVLLKKQNDNLLREGMFLAENKIATINGLLILEKHELIEIIGYCKNIYKEVLQKAGEKFTGHIRFDLIPEVKNFRKTSYGYRWELGIRGCYEINTNSPECGAATAALHTNRSEMSLYQPDPAKRIVDSLNGKINGKEIAFVIGNGAVKKEWGDFFMNSLIKRGLKAVKINPEDLESCKNYRCVWRFGDIREEGYTEFSKEFQKFLISKQMQEESFVLNTVAQNPEEDIGNKKYLLREDEGERELKSEADILWALGQKKDLVLKPFEGASGNGIDFKRNMSPKEWEASLREKVGKNYGLYNAKWLPMLPTQEPEGNIALDISPSFMAYSSSINYLYCISRFEEYERYIERGTINVAQGGGFAGTLLEETF